MIVSKALVLSFNALKESKFISALAFIAIVQPANLLAHDIDFVASRTDNRNCFSASKE